MKNFKKKLTFKRLLGLPTYISITLLLVLSHSISAQSWPAGVHDPSSIVKCDDTYWIFATGNGIQSKYSKDMISWTDGATPFTTTDFPAWISNYAKTDTETFQGHFWAPDIIYMNNKYYLYYSCSM